MFYRWTKGLSLCDASHVPGPGLAPGGADGSVGLQALGRSAWYGALPTAGPCPGSCGQGGQGSLRPESPKPQLGCGSPVRGVQGWSWVGRGVSTGSPRTRCPIAPVGPPWEPSCTCDALAVSLQRGPQQARQRAPSTVLSGHRVAGALRVFGWTLISGFGPEPSRGRRRLSLGTQGPGRGPVSAADEG